MAKAFWEHLHPELASKISVFDRLVTMVRGQQLCSLFRVLCDLSRLGILPPEQPADHASSYCGRSNDSSIFLCSYLFIRYGFATKPKLILLNCSSRSRPRGCNCLCKLIYKMIYSVLPMNCAVGLY